MSNLDSMIESAIAKMVTERVPAVIARMLGAKPSAPVASKPKRGRPKRSAPPPPARAKGPLPGSVGAQVLTAIAKPHTESEFAELLESIDGSDEAKRQAVAKLTRTGRMVVTTERGTRVYRVGVPTAGK